MTDFQHISKEEREEWLRSPVTSAAISMLREMEAVAQRAVIAEATSEGTSMHAIGVKGGQAIAVNQVIDQLTRLPK